MQVKTFTLLTASIFSTCAANAAPEAKFSKADLCKAAIASEMGQPIKTMKILQASSDQPEISYTRKEDGEKFRYGCKIEGSRIIWRAYFNNPVQVGWGRWRNEQFDSLIEYKLSGESIIITNSNFGTIEKYSKKDF